MESKTVTLDIPESLYVNLQTLARREHLDLDELITKLLHSAYQEAATEPELDPVLELIGAYHSEQPLIDDIPASEDPDLYLTAAAAGKLTAGKHACDIAPARYAGTEDE
jgi:hypothetical protein